METEKVTQSKSWLQRLKDESWEAELLVSAVAIFAIIKSFAVLDWLLFQFIDRLDPSQFDIGYFILVFGYLAIGILAAMFTLHFALRAYWIGLVGLNSVFPDYGLEDSAYSPIYTKKILSSLPKISETIKKTDELCSVIFSAAFSFMMIYLYLTVIASLYLIIYNLLDDYIPTWILLIPLAPLVLIFILGFVISVPANMKKNRENETIQHFYFLYAKWGAIIMYGPIHKHVMQITMLFGSNFKKKKGLVKMVLLMLLVGIIFGGVKLIASDYRYLINNDLKLDTSRTYDFFYSPNNSNKQFILAPEIPNEIISKNSLKLFVPIFDHETKLMSEQCTIPEFNFDDDEFAKQKRWSANLECYANKIQVLVDGKPIKIDFLKTEHAITAQFGLSGFLPLETYQSGAHLIIITKKITPDYEKKWQIPFYYSP